MDTPSLTGLRHSNLVTSERTATIFLSYSDALRMTTGPWGLVIIMCNY